MVCHILLQSVCVCELELDIGCSEALAIGKGAKNADREHAGKSWVLHDAYGLPTGIAYEDLQG